MRPPSVIVIWIAMTCATYDLQSQVRDVDEIKPLSLTIPAFPEEMKLRGVSGSVTLEAFLSPEGRVAWAHAIGGDRLFRSGCEEAVSQWILEPDPNKAGFRRMLIYIEFIGWADHPMGNYRFAEQVFPDHRVPLFGERIWAHHKTVDTRPRRCEVHQVDTILGVVPVWYGDRLYDQTYLDAYLRAAKAFPHSSREVYGGFPTRRETRAIVRYCPKCRIAEQRWQQGWRRARVVATAHTGP